MKSRESQSGFTLIEVIIAIIILALVGRVILFAMTSLTTSMPTLQNNVIALNLARECMEWFVGQRQLQGYASITCPSSTVPSFCTTPSGYSIAVNITCTTINSDTNYKTVSVTVSGNGSATLSTLLALY